MPKAIALDDKPRRGRSLMAIEQPSLKNFFLRMLLHSPKDMVAGAVAFAAVGAIIGNAMLMQAGRHPSPMFGSNVVAALGAPFVSPLPKPRPLEAAARPDSKSLDARLLDSRPVDGKAVESKVVENKTLENKVLENKVVDAREPSSMASLLKSSAPPVHTASVTRPPAPSPSATRTDPLGDLILSSRRVASVQRALTLYGYGQLKPTGNVGSETQAAIQRFERDRKMPVTGQISDRLVRELASATGLPME